MSFQITTTSYGYVFILFNLFLATSSSNNNHNQVSATSFQNNNNYKYNTLTCNVLNKNIPSLFAFPNTNGNSHNKNNHNSNHNTSRKKYKQTSDEDDDISLSTTSYSKRSSRTSSSSSSKHFTNTAKKRYQQERSQQRKRKNNNYNKKKIVLSKSKNSSKINPRPFKKVIDIDLTKSNFFTVKTISPPLQMVQHNLQYDNKNNKKKEGSPNRNQNTNSLPQSNHIISPSVVKQNEQNCIPYICGELPITYTNDPSSVEQWLCDNIIKPAHDNTFSYLGFDIEAVPSVPWRKVSLFPHRPSTVQLSTPFSSLVLHLTPNYDDDSNLLGPLQMLLNDETIIKVGAGIDDDMLELYRWNRSLNARSRFDIGGIGSSNNGNRVGLQRLVRAIVGVELVKSKRVAMSDWSQIPLTVKQLNYASRDAWAGAAVMENLSLMYGDKMQADVIGNMIMEIERDMLDIDVRAKERKEAKGEMKKIFDQMKRYSAYLKPSSNKDISCDEDCNNMAPGLWNGVVKEEKDRLQKIIDETSPDGLLFFPQESLGLDFSFEKSSMNNP